VYIPFKELYKQEKRGLKDIKNKYKEKPDNYYKNKFKKLKNKV